MTEPKTKRRRKTKREERAEEHTEDLRAAFSLGKEKGAREASFSADILRRLLVFIHPDANPGREDEAGELAAIVSAARDALTDGT